MRLELHEDEVPELDEPVAVLFRGARRTAPDLRPVVVEELRAGAVGAGVAHPPPVVVGVDADDALVGQARDLLPQVRGLLVRLVDGDEDLFLRKTEDLGRDGPGLLDGDVLEVVAEGEVAQHLEEGVVAGGVADVVEVVVLAAGAHRLLRGGGAGIGARLQPGEHVLELDHARVGEHQRGIVARHDGRGGHDLVVAALEEAQEVGPDLVAGNHACSTPCRVAAAVGRAQECARGCVGPGGLRGKRGGRRPAGGF